MSYAAICNIQIELHEMNEQETKNIVNAENFVTKRLIKIEGETLDECIRKVNEQLRNS